MKTIGEREKRECLEDVCVCIVCVIEGMLRLVVRWMKFVTQLSWCD